VHTFRALVLLVCAVPLFAAQPSNPAASPAARATLDYLAGLKSPTNARLIVGQHVGYVSATYTSTIYFAPNGYDAYVVPLQQQSAKWLGLIGADFASSDPSLSYPVDYNRVTPVLIDHWRKGGLVTVMFSARNPWTGKLAHDRSVQMPMADIVRAGTPANANWVQQLDSLAGGLKVLRDAGVVVLFRPLH
jgi:mannan endo-1,4-beta-mannosidase